MMTMTSRRCPMKTTPWTSTRDEEARANAWTVSAMSGRARGRARRRRRARDAWARPGVAREKRPGRDAGRVLATSSTGRL